MAKELEPTQETIHQPDPDLEWNKAAPPQPPTNGVDAGEVLTYVAQHEVIEDEQGKLRKKKNLLRRHMKNRGVELKIFDDVRKELQAADPEQVLEDQATKDLYRGFLGVPTETQPDMLVRQEQSDAIRGKIAHQQGYVAGHTGKNRDTSPYELNSVEGQEYIKGWHEGQARLAEGLKSLPANVITTETTVNG